MKNPFGQIVSFEDYVDIIGIPKEQLNSEEVKNRIKKQHIKPDFALKMYLHFPRIIYLVKFLRKEIFN